jgi:hypothetical protein
MDGINLKELEDINVTRLSGTTLKKHISNMLANSSQCRAILECMNPDTGEYRIVLQGIIDPE